VLPDLIEARAERGKQVVRCGEGPKVCSMSRCRAGDFSAESATFVRAARDFAVNEPRFAAEIGLVGLQRLLDGSGYDPAVSLVEEALDHLLDAASRIGARDCAKEQAQSLVDTPCSSGRRHM